MSRPPPSGALTGPERRTLGPHTITPRSRAGPPYNIRRLLPQASRHPGTIPAQRRRISCWCAHARPYGRIRFPFGMIAKSMAVRQWPWAATLQSRIEPIVHGCCACSKSAANTLLAVWEPGRTTSACGPQRSPGRVSRRASAGRIAESIRPDKAVRHHPAISYASPGCGPLPAPR